MSEMSHEDYRNTEYWYNLRHKLLVRCGGYCEKCHKRLYGEEFDLHHVDGVYRMFDEDQSKMMVLCRECHSTFHKADYIIPDGIHDFRVVGVEPKIDKRGVDGYSITLSVKRKYDGKECYAWYWAQRESVYEHRFCASVGLHTLRDYGLAVDLTGRALFKRDGDYNKVERFFTKVTNFKEEY